MPIVTISVWEEFGQDRARQLIKGVTDSFVQVGIPAQAVQVVIHEVPRSHWGDGGRVASERSGQSDSAAASHRGQRSERPQGRPRQERPSRPPGRSRQERSSRQERPSRPDTRPGSRPRRGGSGSR